jgi:hypothetical protein
MATGVIRVLSLRELSSDCRFLAHMIQADGAKLDCRILTIRMLETLEWLKNKTIPGWEMPSPDRRIRSQERLAWSQRAWELNRPEESFAEALRSIAIWPHHMEGFVLAARAAYRQSAPKLADALIHHAHWIQPGHPKVVTPEARLQTLIGE